MTSIRSSKYGEYFRGETMSGGAPKWLGYFERILSRRSQWYHYVADTKEPSPADYLLFDLLDYHEELGGGELWKNFLAENGDKLEELFAWRNMMASRPGIKAYLASDKRRGAR